MSPIDGPAVIWRELSPGSKKKGNSFTEYLDNDKNDFRRVSGYL